MADEVSSIFERKYNDLVDKIVNAPPGTITPDYKVYLLNGAPRSRDAASVHVVPPARPSDPGRGASGDSPDRSGHPSTHTPRAPLRAVEPVQESLLYHCPACRSGDKATRLNVKVAYDYYRKCTDPWHSN